jgi:hypothetical protein
MERYWPKFLEEFVAVNPAVTAATTPTPAAIPPKVAADSASGKGVDEKEKDASKSRSNRMLDRVRRAMPFRRQ